MLPALAALPAPGVYEVDASINGEQHKGIANVGLRPTIRENEKRTRLEAHFLNTSQNLYGTSLHVRLRRFIRPEMKFENVTILKKQIERDIASLTSYLS